MILPTQYLLKYNRTLSWSDILWGLNNNYLTPGTIVKLAIDKSNTSKVYNGTLIELCGVTKNEIFMVHELVDVLAKRELAHLGDGSKSKWLVLVLNWLFINRDAIENVFEEVELVYSDFDYPPELSSFIR